MTATDYRDPLSSSLALSPEERARVRIVADRDWSAIEAAILASLTSCEQTTSQIQDVVRRIRCAT